MLAKQVILQSIPVINESYVYMYVTVALSNNLSLYDVTVVAPVIQL